MKQEKWLLFKDLCSRLPYNVICKLSVKGADVSITEKLDLGGLEHFMFGTMDVKPYLRPMPSMTEEERRYLLEELGFNEDLENVELNDFGSYVYRSVNVLPLFDWLNEHHFDYHGLIPMGLALKAPEDMYKTE